MRTLNDLTGSQRQALKITGVSRSTWHYRMNPRPRTVDPVHQADRAYSTRISPEDRERIEECILAGWSEGNSVDHSFATAWDSGIMLAPRRAWWRIAAALEEQMLRPKAPTRKQNRTQRGQKPVLKATGPGQVWSWDITDLYSPYKNRVFKAYSIIDIFSRQIVGCRVEDREADHLAVDMFQQAIQAHGAPAVVHADSGPAMKSNALKNMLEARGVELSHNRPYVSNDNPFSESAFRTMKYRPGYPKVFAALEDARTYLDDYVPWYNEQHKHSGIALFSPAQVHDGSWQQVSEVRQTALEEYFRKHPSRFHARPVTPSPAGIVGINLPSTRDETVLQTA
ncbi:transposase [Glutamicibacter arilaitensis]|uniref:transposase n=1 Tax=Glutamicibacter arilaitensis TaxID=256701 RepID=UPI003F932634